jgi:hypothetical protein
VSSTRILLVLLDRICDFAVTLNCLSRSLTLLNWQGGKSTLENCQVLQVHPIYSAMQLRIIWRWNHKYSVSLDKIYNSPLWYLVGKAVWQWQLASSLSMTSVTYLFLFLGQKPTTANWCRDSCRLQWIDLKATRLRYPNPSSYRRVHIVGFQVNKIYLKWGLC